MNSLDQFKNTFEQTVLISFDVTGAFDRVKWSSLAEIMNRNEINRNLRQITTQSFFENRKIGLFDEDNDLELEHELYSGVSQEPVLSPTLFNVSMTKIQQTIKETNRFKLLSYADGLLMIVGIDKIKDCQIIR